MRSPLSSLTSAVPHGGTGELGWLLVNFLEEVPGVDAAVLGTLDGLPLASAGLAASQPDHLAAVSTTLHSSGKAGGNVIDPPGGDVQLVMIQLSHRNLFVMSTWQDGGPVDTTTAGVAATLLTVLADRTADTRMVGNEMTKLITSVARHLSTEIRTSTSTPDTAPGPDDER